VRRRGKQIAIRVETRRGAQLEIWSARGRADQLERMLDRTVTIGSARPAGREKRVVGSAARRVEAAPAAANGGPRPASAGGAEPTPPAPVRAAAVLPLRRRG